MKVRYVRLPKLFTELAIARGDGSFPKVMAMILAVSIKKKITDLSSLPSKVL